MLDKLEMFIAVAREGHFGRAAESLNISQPTLSAGIKQLEEQLGVQLVLRGSRFGGLTSEGQIALPRAQRLVEDARQLHEEMRVMRDGLSGDLRLAVIPTALPWAARLSAAFMRKHPETRFTILSRTSREIVGLMETFEVDAGITYLDNEPLRRVDTASFYDETYMLVCPRDAPLARAASLDWKELDGKALALLTPDMQNRRILNAIFAECGIAPVTAVETNSIIALVASVAAGGCMTVLPADMAGFLGGGTDVALVPLTGGARAQPVGLIVPRRDPRSPLVEALLREAGRVAGSGRSGSPIA
ncbi:transcriptional regulator [Oceaniovalibus guishaninsula JLT2003]|uniref:Transcriptional regulator n=1 Tax=Oceaniovalibus guishaninsula JLT2003 TaxID=1231392 RepID=K2I769_9RHOB|nr:LysR family transcriptional regulator [Oceaniovalibus guishaninsula]EKE44865.1 transcriptional regulator [Oceaniovalibus guishaninsula JLT2003]